MINIYEISFVNGDYDSEYTFQGTTRDLDEAMINDTVVTFTNSEGYEIHICGSGIQSYMIKKEKTPSKNEDKVIPIMSFRKDYNPQDAEEYDECEDCNGCDDCDECDGCGYREEDDIPSNSLGTILFDGKPLHAVDFKPITGVAIKGNPFEWLQYSHTLGYYKANEEYIFSQVSKIVADLSSRTGKNRILIETSAKLIIATNKKIAHCTAEIANSIFSFMNFYNVEMKIEDRIKIIKDIIQLCTVGHRAAFEQDGLFVSYLQSIEQEKDTTLVKHYGNIYLSYCLEALNE